MTRRGFIRTILSLFVTVKVPVTEQITIQPLPPLKEWWISGEMFLTPVVMSPSEFSINYSKIITKARQNIQEATSADREFLIGDLWN